MPLYVKNSGTWEEVDFLSVKDAGTWESVKVGYIKNSGTWDPFYSGIVVSLHSGTEYQSNAVYTSNLGSSAYWYKVDISGTITYMGQAATMAWDSGYKMFASIDPGAAPAVRSNYVGEYAIEASYSGSVQSYTIPSTIPDQWGNASISNIQAELWGGGSSGRGGYTYLDLGTPTGTIYYAVGSQGTWNDGFTGVCRFQWDRFGCASQDQVTNGWTGLFKVDPYDGTTNYRDPSVIPADSDIYGVAGGMSSAGDVGGGTTGGGSRGGTQSSHGSFYLPNINNACYSSCTGISGAVFRTCPSKLIGSWIASGFETCTYSTGGGGYYPGGSSTNPPCSSAGAGGGSGYYNSSNVTSGSTNQGTGNNQSSSPYYTGNSKIAIRIR